MAVKVVPKEEMLDAIGTKFEPGAWIEVTQDRINTFADCTEDHQFIHVDPGSGKKYALRRHHRPRFPDPVPAVQAGRGQWRYPRKYRHGPELRF